MSEDRYAAFFPYEFHYKCRMCNQIFTVRSRGQFEHPVRAVGGEEGSAHIHMPHHCNERSAGIGDLQGALRLPKFP